MSATYTVELKLLDDPTPVTEFGSYAKQTIFGVELGDYPHEIAVDFWNAAMGETDGLKKGDAVVVAFRIKTKKTRDGRLFTNLNGTSATKLGEPEPAPSYDSGGLPPLRGKQPSQPPKYHMDNTIDDDVPF